MNSGRYMLPNSGMNFGMAPMIGANHMFPRNVGLLRRIASGIRSFNWGGLITGANKTLNVVNQTIPLIRQAKPMFNNIRSMINLARAFGNETSKKEIYTIKNNPLHDENNYQKKEVQNNNYPNFFI